jgi:dihydroorotase
VIDLKKLIRLLVFAPRERFGISISNDYSVWKMDEFIVEPSAFLSKGKATPYEGEKLYGVNQLTVYNGKIVYKK